MLKEIRTSRQATVIFSILAIGIVIVTLATPYAHRIQDNENRLLRNVFSNTSLPAMDTLLSDVLFVAFDTETTGVNPNYERIIEIAAVKFKNGKILEEKSWLVNPEKFIPKGVQNIHKTTPEMVEDQPIFKKIYPEFARFVAGSVLLAHNAPFDVKFVQIEAGRCHYMLPPNDVIDSLRLFRRTYPTLKSHSLAAVAEFLNIKSGQFHRAADDSVYMARILKMFRHLGAKATLAELYELAGGKTAFN
ncbi:MAG: hypothetical protein GKR87_00265 [Kiritimatiellae bacterium]|nr:hypothetical protein [Kiritimatiellia bacterium]